MDIEIGETSNYGNRDPEIGESSNYGDRDPEIGESSNYGDRGPDIGKSTNYGDRDLEIGEPSNYGDNGAVRFPNILRLPKPIKDQMITGCILTFKIFRGLKGFSDDKE